MAIINAIVHEATAFWDVSYAATARRSSQSTASAQLLEMIPLMASLIMRNAVLNRSPRSPGENDLFCWIFRTP
jgi:hypothetical protein